MSDKNKMVDTAVYTEKTEQAKQQPDDFATQELNELSKLVVKKNDTLDEISDFMYEITLARINVLVGNLYALKYLNEASKDNRQLLEARASILNNVFTIVDEIQYDCELVSEQNFDELAERHTNDKDKVLR